MGRRRRGLVSGVWVLLLFVAVFGVVLNVPVVWGSGTIYIRADGSIDPPTAPIQRNGDIYTFTGNIYDQIVVQRSNIVINGDGYTLQGSGTGNGFYLRAINNVTIKNTNIKGFGYGVDLADSSDNTLLENNITDNTEMGVQVWLQVGDSSDNNTLFGNTITNNWYGVYLFLSSNNLFRNNSIVGNRYNFGVSGYRLSDFIQDVDTSNTVDGKPVYYWINRQGMQVPLDAGFVALVNSTSITVTGLDLKNNYQGIVLAYTTDLQITNNTITNNLIGVDLYNSSYNSISENNITNNDHGVLLRWYSKNNTISKNTIAIANEWGIYLNEASYNTISANIITENGNGVGLSMYSTNNTISGNNITDNYDNYGLYLYYSSNNTVYGNNVKNNNNGIMLWSSAPSYLFGNTIANNYYGLIGWSNNKIYHNNFINNTHQVDTLGGSGIVWDDGYPSCGNYWSNYVGQDSYSGMYQNVTGSDGIGDTPYDIDANNRDRYPFMSPYETVAPLTVDDHDGIWHNNDFTITLRATDIGSGVAEVYYKIDNGPTKTVSTDGQPLITTEGANNTLEYWSVDKAGNEELPHKILTGIKLDKTYPSIETPSRTPDGDVQPDQSVKVSVNVTDATSNVKNVTLSYTINDGETWTDLPMNHTTSNLYEATIPPQQADTTVKFKITAYDHAGNNTTLDGTQPYCTYQVIPEFPPSLILPLFIITTLLAAICFRRKQKTTLKII